MIVGDDHPDSDVDPATDAVTTSIPADRPADGLVADFPELLDTGADDADGLPIDADSDADADPDVLVQELLLDDGDGTDDASNGAAALRLVKVVAVVAAAGWLITLLANVLSPSTLLDTTDREETLPLVEADEAVEAEEAGIGGGADLGLADQAEAATVIQVDGTDGPVVAPGNEDGTGTETTADGSTSTDPDATTAGSAAEGSSSTSPNGSATSGADAAGTGTAGTDTTGAPAEAAAGGTPTAGAAAGPAPSSNAGQTSNYRSNLELIRSASIRNTNHDGSAQRGTAQAGLVPAQHYGPRNEYLGNPGGSPEQAFPVANGGQFRTACEFSHFAYDDPLIYPGQPGASHLHMFFGNTDVNAFSTHDSLINTGSSTCNGQELNRTGYWVPALFDGAGNVRVPDRVVVYYKGEGLARGNSQIYPDGAAMVVQNLNTTPSNQGGVGGAKMTYVCSDNYSANTGNGSQTMPNCQGSGSPAGGTWTVLEVNVKFPQCWNGQDAGNINNWAPPSGDWYGSYCGGEYNRTLPNLEYFVNYRVEPGENTSNWYLSSDVDASDFGTAKATGGSTSHGDWWGGWHPDVNQMWIDNCVNFRTSAPSGCGFGYLSDGGPNGGAPYDGPALKMRPNYTGPTKIPAATVFAELCPNPNREFRQAEDAAYCTPG